MRAWPDSQILTCFVAIKTYIAVTHHWKTCLYTLHKEKGEEKTSNKHRLADFLLEKSIQV